MSRYTTETEGHRFEIELADGGNQARLNGKPVALDPVWLNGLNGNLHLLLNGRSYDLRIEEDDDRLIVTYAGRRYDCSVIDSFLADLQQRAGIAGVSRTRTVVKSPMPGLVVKTLVTAGETVKRGGHLLVIEAMKMENDIKAPGAGTVVQVSVKSGDIVKSGQELVVIE